jgi:hypothetical protein
MIRNTDMFILLATDNTVASKWCNWELWMELQGRDLL